MIWLAPELAEEQVMPHTPRGPLGAALPALSFGSSALAQSNQVWPETSTFVKLTDKTRF
jgi:hypothetical protein